ncbi:MAG: CopG family transcriptional regulator [Betaproteobacteria bacterium]|jgi:predicted transcriptional regulator|nr:CopG family transcriptional regulator [Betaproteobacteria bacterium]
MVAKTLNVRLPEDLYNQIEALASATARTKSYLTIDALNDYVQRESWQIRDIHEGIREADAGEFATEDQVKAVFAKHGA